MSSAAVFVKQKPDSQHTASRGFLSSVPGLSVNFFILDINKTINKPYLLVILRFVLCNLVIVDLWKNLGINFRHCSWDK